LALGKRMKFIFKLLLISLPISLSSANEPFTCLSPELLKCFNISKETCIKATNKSNDTCISKFNLINIDRENTKPIEFEIYSCIKNKFILLSNISKNTYKNCEHHYVKISQNEFSKQQENNKKEYNALKELNDNFEELHIHETKISAYANNNECHISPIPNKLIEYGCSCNFYEDNNTEFIPYLQSEIDFTNPKMYINNKLVKLKTIQIEGIPKKPKIGNKFTQIFEYSEKTIYFENTISFVCPPNSESCETTEFNTIMYTKQKQCNIKSINLKGNCGC